MKYFTIKELTKTSTGISNIPNAEHIANLIYLVWVNRKQFFKL